MSLFQAFSNLYLRPNGDPQEGFLIVSMVNDRLVCPIHGCSKDFGNLNGIKYHLNHHLHDLQPLLDDCGIETSERVTMECQALIPGSKTPIKVTVLFELMPDIQKPVKKVRYNGLPLASKDQLDIYECKIDLTMDVNASCSTLLMELPLSYLPHRTEINMSHTAMNLFQIQKKSTKQSTQFTLFCGGSVWGMDWSHPFQSEQYLAIAGYKGNEEEHHVIGKEQTLDLQNMIQIYAFHDLESPSKASARLSVCLLHDFGCVYHLKWSPFTRPNSTIVGLLACTFGDGTMRVFSVPRFEFSDKMVVQAIPEFTAQIESVLLWKCDWYHPDKIIVGSSIGDLTAWHISLDQSVHHIPLFSIEAHDSIIRSVSAIRDPLHSEDLNLVLSCGYDGKILVHDLRDPFTSLGVYRMSVMAYDCSWAQGEIYFADFENDLRALRIEEYKPTCQTLVSSHLSTVWSVDASLHMPFIASGGLDGTLRIGNHKLNLRTYRGEMQNIYQLEWDQENNVYSFVELNKHKPKGSQFPIQVAVQKVCWNPNPKTPQWIASGMNCGLVRVETVYSAK